MGDTRVLKDADSCTPLSMQNGWLRVDWYNADEGVCGDYNPDDPDDVNLLRFDVYVKDGGKWSEVSDASYCTQMSADTSPKILERALRFLFRAYEDALRSDHFCSVKKLGEELSWISPSNFAD